MPLLRSDSATRVLREIVIVVVGILIAFGLDAGWDNYTESVQEKVHLRALTSDFQQNAERLRALIKTEERISASSLTLLTIARREGPAPTDSVVRLLGMIFNSNRYEPVMGAYEGLVNSAGLTLIEDDSLRALLAEFSSQANGRYAERFADELYFSFIREFAGRLRFFDEAVAPSGATISYEPLLRDQKFQEYLALRHLSERDMARRYVELLGRTEAILARLKTQVD